MDELKQARNRMLGAYRQAVQRAEEALNEAEEELTVLREEVARLRQTLSDKEAEQQKTLRELGEFNRLFPDVAIKSVPKQVWSSVSEGIPLCAAYALYEKKIQQEAARAEGINRQNASRSAGQAGRNTAKEYFSPDEVRAMSQKQVHESYAKIMASMKPPPVEIWEMNRAEKMIPMGWLEASRATEMPSKPKAGSMVETMGSHWAESER